MAQVPPVSRLRVEDLPKELVEPFTPVFASLNTFMQTVSQALNKQLGVDENFLGFSHEVTARTTEFPISFVNKLRVKPRHLFVSRAVLINPGTGEEMSSVPCAAAWSVLDSGDLEVSDPTSLTPGETYKFTILVLA